MMGLCSDVEQFEAVLQAIPDKPSAVVSAEVLSNFLFKNSISTSLPNVPGCDSGDGTSLAPSPAFHSRIQSSKYQFAASTIVVDQVANFPHESTRTCEQVSKTADSRTATAATVHKVVQLAEGLPTLGKGCHDIQIHQTHQKAQVDGRLRVSKKSRPK
ncbi:conserved hypothetical protein [Ricinus communis]|uniref:Uncharacterized protein n=1 Tax=Ricinus communis TaxID=3988 RepID=B9RPT4_RICCO|nr:conserved hypothetical protein [Ricinus communis]